LLVSSATAYAQNPTAPAGQAPNARQPAAGAADTPGDAPPLNTFEEKLSYAVGLNTGRMIQQQGLNPDPDLFIRGFRDSFKETDPLLTDEEIQALFAKVQQDLQEKANAAQKKLADNWKESFSAEKKPKGEPKATASGLKYEVFAQGEGEKTKA